MNMHRIVFGTSRQSRYRLSWIEQAFGIKNLANQVKLITLLIAELNAHFAQFLDTHTMFAGNRTALFDTQLQNFTTELFGFFELPGIVTIVENKRVEITIAGVENIRNAQFVLLRQSTNFSQNSTQRFARNSPVDTILIRR